MTNRKWYPVWPIDITTKVKIPELVKITFVKKQDLHQFNELATAKQPLLLATHPSEFYTLIATAPVLELNAKAKVHSKKGLLFTGPPIYALDCFYLI